MITSTTVNQSFTHEFPVAESLTGGAFTAISLTENGVVTAGASSIPVGIWTGLYNSDGVTAQISGGSLWFVGNDSVTAGDFLTSGDGGVAVKAQSGDFAFARALENASANSAVAIQIVNAGKI